MTDRRVTGAVVIGIVLTFAMFVVGLRTAVLAEISGVDPDAKVLAAAVGLAGALMASVASFLGYLLKSAVDLRAEQRLALEAERNHNLQREAETRLKLDVAVRAIQLMSPKAGIHNIQRSGALFTLASLQQFDLLLALTSNLLKHDQIDPTTAARVLEAVLRKVTNSSFEIAPRYWLITLQSL